LVRVIASTQGFLHKLHAFVQGRACCLKRGENFAKHTVITFTVEGYDVDVWVLRQHNPFGK
jgi:hypothetical protein